MVGVLPHPGMLPKADPLPHQKCSRDAARMSIAFGPDPVRARTSPCFPVRLPGLLSRPDLAASWPRRATEGHGRSGATRSHAQRAVAREHGEDGEHRTFPDVSTVAHCSLVGVVDRPAPLASVTSRNPWRRWRLRRAKGRCLICGFTRGIRSQHHLLSQFMPPGFHPAL
jgi:hypothetical protein